MPCPSGPVVVSIPGDMAELRMAGSDAKSQLAEILDLL